MIKITGFPKEATLAEICNIFKKNNCDIENLDDKIEITGAKGDGPVLLTELDEIDYELVMEQMDGHFIKGKRLKRQQTIQYTMKKSSESISRMNAKYHLICLSSSFDKAQPTFLRTA